MFPCLPTSGNIVAQKYSLPRMQKCFPTNSATFLLRKQSFLVCSHVFKCLQDGNMAFPVRKQYFTANLGQVFLFQIPYLIAIFLFTFAILKKFVANLLRNIANLLSQLKTPHFLLEVPHFLLGKCVLFPVPKLTFILLYFHIKDYFCT